MFMTFANVQQEKVKKSPYCMVMAVEITFYTPDVIIEERNIYIWRL